jgi:hypothetical protein
MTAAHLSCIPGKAASAAAINFLNRGEFRMFELVERREIAQGLINIIYMVVGKSTAPFQTLQVGGLLP